MSRGKIKTAKGIARKELNKERFEKKAVGFLLFMTAISVSILFLFLVSQVSLSGYATSIDAEAGSITEMTLYRQFDTSFWNGIYGLALRVPDFTEQLHGDFDYAEITRQDLFFNCIQTGIVGGNEVYASTSNVIDFINLVPATAQMVDDYTGCIDSDQCAVNTFTENFNFTVGGITIDDVPGAYTYRWDGQKDVFGMGILHDGTNLVYVSKIGEVGRSYDYEKLVNYQMLLPIRDSSSEHYYFFTDPFDECPAGAGIGENIVGHVSGFIFDEAGLPIVNTTVIIAGVNATSQTDGAYNLSFSVSPGDYNLFAKKLGYDDFFDNVTVNFTQYEIEKNITMKKFSPGIDETISVIVSGLVKDIDGIPLADVKVILGESIAYSGDTGNYTIVSTITMGEHSLVAVKETYNNYHKTLNFTIDGQSLVEDIVLEQATQNYEFETGPYTEEPKEAGVSQEIIDEIISKGEDYWISSKEINKEVRQNTFVEEEIGIYNLRKTHMNINFKLSPNLKDFVKIDKATISIAPDAYSYLRVTLYGTQPLGEYEGTLTISGDLDQEIPIKIKIVEKKFPVEVLLMDIDLFNNVVQPGSSLRYKLNLQNLLRDQNYEVALTARLKSLKSQEVVLEQKFDTEVENSMTLLKEFSIPANFTAGDYILEINADYLNLFSTVTTSLIVSRPIYLYSFFGIPLWLMFSIISFFSFVSLNLFMYKRYNDKKKRYRIEVDYSTLPEPGPRVVKLGRVAETKHPVYYELERMTTHGIVAGGTGMGKSISAQVFIEECLMKDIAVLVFDPTAQWSGMLRKCTDKKMMSFYPKFGMKKTDARAFKGNVRMIKDAKQKLEIEKYVNPGQIQIFSMNKLTPSEIDIFVANTIKQIFRSDPKESPTLRVLLVFDEVHRLLPKFGGSGAGFLQIERSCREFRKWGLGVMLISQVLNDFAGQIKANINTEFQARTLEEGDLNRIKTKYGEEFLKSLVRAEVGVIMFQNAEYNRGRPYFVNFRPILHSTRRLSDEELEQYNKYNDLVDDIEFQVNELEKEKIDTFDLKMELKLIKDKIMTGSFSVVEIYLEGLVPRVKKEWEKLGKEAPKLELELVDDAEMAEEEAKSAAEKEKATKEEKAKPKEEVVVKEEEKKE